MVASELVHSTSTAKSPRDQELLETLLSGSGVNINGAHPYDIQVHDPRFVWRVLARGTLGAGETYVDGVWDCAQLDEMVCRLLRVEVETRMSRRWQWWAVVRATLLNLQRPSRAFTVGARHYDIGDDLFEIMLDRRMIYTCAYWRQAHTLDEAQEHKLDLVCRKLGLQAGMSVLDIGCGWGGAARYAAERYGVKVTGITVSRNQAAAATAHCRGLPIDIQLQDYRSLRGRFDRIYSVGMFEHVGLCNYREYFVNVRRLLASDGLFLLHTIGRNISQRSNENFTEKYIFPNSLVPSAQQITAALERQFVVEDWHSFGVDYDRTLMAWYRRFEDGWPSIAGRYGERFHRLWSFWLRSSAACFRARNSHLWQILLSPRGVLGGYPEIR